MPNQPHTPNEGALPDLNVSVLEALRFLADAELPTFPPARHKRPLVVGSANAASVGRLLFDDVDAVFATESDVAKRLGTADVDGVVVVSASGGKHAPIIAKIAKEKGKRVLLITNTSDSPTAAILDRNGGDELVVFPKLAEPYSYNVSTYLGMLFAKTGEDPAGIADFIEKEVAPVCDTALLGKGAFFLVVPAGYGAVGDMMRTKFDELFGAQVCGRVFTEEEAKHAKTIVPSEEEVFVNFGERGRFGAPEARLSVPLPQNAGPAALMSIGYFVIGKIQAAHPPYFKDNIAQYMERANQTWEENT